MVITATRASVCMGDDVMAPNTRQFNVSDDMKLSGFLPQLMHYLPDMKDSVWTAAEAEASVPVLAFVIFDENGNCSFELNGDDIPLSFLHDHSIYCHYYYSGCWTYRDSSGNIHEGPPGATLLEQVRSSLKK